MTFWPQFGALRFMSKSERSEKTKLLPLGVYRSVCEVVEEGEDPSPTLASKGDQVGTFGDKYFEVDHPFVFFLWDYLASSVVLMGRVVTPEPILLPPTP